MKQLKLLEYRKEKLHIVSFSGGKDSAAMLLRMIELGDPIDKIIFFDTGKEFPELYDYVKRMSAYTKETIGVEVEWIQPHATKSGATFEDWFYGKRVGGFHDGKQRGWPMAKDPGCWWSRQSKMVPGNKICNGHYRYLGFAKNEEKRVKFYKTPNPRTGKSKHDDGHIYPMVDWDWNEEDAREYLIERGWAEPFHVQFNRTGCYLCPYQPVKSLKVLARKYPHHYEEILELQKNSPNDFKPGIGYDELLKIREEALAEGDSPEETRAEGVGSGCPMKEAPSLIQIGG
ncbi:phosphoadenosine phosphosulfate reductase family protein [candidate division TA06 bacterium]|nr:phosphoadenosine phosphosulfate reductase family protein [candidate division TA06 bacterium]